MKNKIMILTIIILTFAIILIPLKGSYAFYSDNKDLNIINTKVGDFRDNIIKLRENDKNNNLSEDDSQGGMYRYQGTDDVANWICFGTTENCGANDDLIDKYMYRIIGITKEGQLYLIKETFLKEGNNKKFPWNNFYHSVDPDDEYYCPEGLCSEWPDSSLFKRINGISNGTGVNTDIFVDSAYYDYLKSGDSYNGTKDNLGSKWYQLIENHDWMYGESYELNSLGFSGNNAYSIETGRKETKRLVGIKGNISEESYTWNKSIKAKISLMFVSDYLYSYYDGINEKTRGNAGNASSQANCWLFYAKDGYETPNYYELFSSSRGVVASDDPRVTAYVVSYDGDYGYSNLSNSNTSRPVFYLNSKVMISHGKGIKSDPFIIAI